MHAASDMREIIDNSVDVIAVTLRKRDCHFLEFIPVKRYPACSRCPNQWVEAISSDPEFQTAIVGWRSYFRHGKLDLQSMILVYLIDKRQSVKEKLPDEMRRAKNFVLVA